MPKGPQGQKRPADVIGCAVAVARIATGEAEDACVDLRKRKAGLKGGKARAASMSAKRRSEIAKEAAGKRWKKD